MEKRAKPHEEIYDLMAMRVTTDSVPNCFAALGVILGTSTLKETVEQAFLEVLRERARRQEVEALSAMEGMDLDDDEVMARAWRT